MTIRSILFLYRGEDYEASALDEACRLAVQAKAEVHVLHVIAPIGLYPDVYGSEVARFEKESQATAEKAQACAEKGASDNGLPFSRDWFSDPQPVLPRVVFRAVTGDVREQTRKFGRAADMVVVGRGEPDSLVDLDLVLAGLMEAGTPVLVVPADASPWFGQAHKSKSVVLAWDGSVQAGRAMRSLEGVLAPEQMVQILCVLHGSAPHWPCPPAMARSWLELHGFRAHVARAGPFVSPAGDTVLKSAEHLEAGLLVMGGYGHSHWSQLVWGGVTNHILKSAGLPVLLHH